MAKINKRVKSFSPYSYNISYRSPGSSPFQKGKYIKSAKNNLEEMVVSQLKTSFGININVSLKYSISNNCEISFDESSFIFNIMSIEDIKKNDIKKDFLLINLFNEKKSFKINVKVGINSFNINWISNNKLKISNLTSNFIDLIILDENKNFINFKYKIIDIDKIQIEFDDILDKNDLLTIIIYNFNNIEYEYIDIDKKNLIDDDINNKLIIKNLLGDNDLNILLYDLDNNVKKIDAIDITPSFIFLNKDCVLSKESLINTVNELEFSKNSIIKNNQGITEDSLLEIDENFKKIIDNINIFNKKINYMLSNNINYDINNLIIYRNLNNNKIYNIQVGLTRENISQIIKDDKLIVRIQHNFDGYVNYHIDTNNSNLIFLPLYVKHIDSNNIEFEFNMNNICPVFSISIFKIL